MGTGDKAQAQECANHNLVPSLTVLTPLQPAFAARDLADGDSWGGCSGSHLGSLGILSPVSGH